jgi:hypothetical protein
LVEHLLRFPGSFITLSNGDLSQEGLEQRIREATNH